MSQYDYFEKISDSLFSQLKTNEDLVLNFASESAVYLRFNENRVRQNTNVDQIFLSLLFQSNKRTVEKSISVGGNLANDKKIMDELLSSCRKEASMLPEDPNQVPVVNNGSSKEEFKGELLTSEQLIESVQRVAEGSDLAGLYFGGTVIAAVRNSKGQNHWFSTESFFMDYSLYNGPKASKAVYAGSNWSQKDWEANFLRAKEQLELLEKPMQNIKPGKYRTYLAPGAVSALVGMMGWGALSASSWKQGRSPMKKLAEKEAKLSPLFNVKENFTLGITPRFNGLGEVAPEVLNIIKEGELCEFLVSSRTAKEYGLKSNAAGDGESPRSMEVPAGDLSEADLLKELGTGLYLSNLHYLNWSDPVTARITGMTRYACFWVENGEIKGPIKDLRFDISLYDVLGADLLAITDWAEIDPSVSTYGGRALGGAKTPGFLIKDFTFTL